ncbi:MAG TPA: inorganic diphosphatase, partial [Xanthomonadales bacterium]|nr:inorganic diphosphatase [Xanthomonadales bacterium]
DTKLVAVPIRKVYSGYDKVESVDDLPEHWRERIGHFFEHYKDLEKGKWVKVEGWAGPDAAKQEILDAIERHKAAKPKPKF